MMKNISQAIIIWDFNRTIYDPDTKKLVPGVRGVLDALFASGCTMVLVSRHEGQRRLLLQKYHLEKYFADVRFVEQKSTALFREIVAQFPHDRVYVIGDYLHSEIYYGNATGAHTIWLKRGKFAHMTTRSNQDAPDDVAHNMQDVARIFAVM